MANVKLKIGKNYKRTVPVQLPGDEIDKPEEVKLTVVYRDIAPDELKKIMEDITGLIRKYSRVIQGAKNQNVSEEDLDEIGDIDYDEITKLFDRVVVTVENLDVEDEHGNMLQGQELKEFIKNYKRISLPIMRKWREENQQGEVALGNLQ